MFTVIALCSCDPVEQPDNGKDVKKEEPKPDTLCVEDKLIDSIRQKHNMTALSYTVVKDFKIVHSGALGIRDRNLKTPIDTGSIFRIASCSKSFTGAAAMQLVDEGKMTLNDDVSDILGFDVRNPYFPDVPITVGMLLSHTSSLQGDEDGMGNSLANIDPMRNSSDLISHCFYEEKPGTKYHYSNKGLTVAAACVEKVRGERFDSLVVNHLLIPLGITNSGFNPNRLDASTFVMSYVYRAFENEYFFQSSPWSSPKTKGYVLGYNTDSMWPAGGMNTSSANRARGMLMFLQYGKGVNGERLLSGESAKVMLTPYTNAGTYGITLNKYGKYLDGLTLYGHTGSKYGFKSFMVFDPVSGFGFTAIASSINTETYSITKLIPVLYKLFIDPNYFVSDFSLPSDDDENDIL